MRGVMELQEMNVGNNYNLLQHKHVRTAPRTMCSPDMSRGHGAGDMGQCT